MNLSELNIIAIIVVYHPNCSKLTSLLKCLCEQVDIINIVDNSENKTEWLNKYTDESNYHIVQNGENLGIAKAQNIALDWTIDNYKDKDLIVFFDQDSVVRSSLITNLKNSYIELMEDKKAAAVGPVFSDETNGFLYPIIRFNRWGIFQSSIPKENKKYSRVNSLISSGMMTSVRRIKDIGLYDSQLFIDYVDTDWCLKAQSKGYNLYVCHNAKMKHSIGDKSIYFSGRYLRVHSPFRRYYMIRNSFLMCRKSYVSSALGISFIFRTLVHHAIIICCERKRLQQINALGRGLLDGIFKDRFRKKK